MINWYVIAIVLIVEYFLWVAWLTKDGFFEAGFFAPHSIIDAIQWSYLRLKWSFNTEAKTMGLAAKLAHLNKQRREANVG